MPNVNAVPICYVGDGLGAEPVTRLRSGLTNVHWNRHDRRVQMIPEGDAVNLLRDNPQDFRACVRLEDGHAGLTGEQLAALGDAVHVEVYRQKRGGDEVPVLVLDEVTAARLDDLTARAKTLAETGEVDTSGLPGRRQSKKNADQEKE